MTEMAALMGIIVGISQIFKNIGLVPKYIPLLNLILGIVLSMFFLSNEGLKESIFQGLIVGLSASGLYDQSKIIKTSAIKESKS